MPARSGSSYPRPLPGPTARSCRLLTASAPCSKPEIEAACTPLLSGGWSSPCDRSRLQLSLRGAGGTRNNVECVHFDLEVGSTPGASRSELRCRTSPVEAPRGCCGDGLVAVVASGLHTGRGRRGRCCRRRRCQVHLMDSPDRPPVAHDRAGLPAPDRREFRTAQSPYQSSATPSTFFWSNSPCS